MRKGFTNLPNIGAQHNEQHRKCFMLPFLVREVTSTPTVDQLDELELVYNSSDHKVYTKIDGVIKSIGDANAAGSDTQVQYNNGGSFGGAQITYNDSTLVTRFPAHIYLKEDQRLYFDAT